jgi:peptidoglycan/LPS O-acetylase OafA/YrhL
VLQRDRPQIVWRAVLSALWLGSVLAAVWGGFTPGFKPGPRLEHDYPFAEVVFVCLLTGLLAFGAYALLRRPTWRRHIGAAILSSALAALFMATFIIDQPGHFYAPHIFALGLAAVMLLSLVVRGALHVWRRASPRGGRAAA